MEETSKNFQDFTDLIGGFGRWQKTLIGISVWNVAVFAICNLNWPFLAYRVDYWCARTSKYMNMSVEEWKNISAPMEIRNGRTTHSRCEIYDINDEKYEKNFSNIPCRSWEYDHSQYRYSVIEKWDLVCENSWLSSLAGSSYFVGFFVSGIVSGQISDRYGRRPVIISGLVLHITFGILCSFSPYYWMFIVSRFFFSAGISASNLTYRIYVMEVVGPTHREKVIVINSLAYCIGMLMITGVSWFLKDSTYIQLFCSLPAILTLIFIRSVIMFDAYVLALNADMTGGNIFLLFLLFSLLQACVSAVLSIILPRFGRRSILMFGFLSVGITSLLITAVPNDLVWLRIVFVVLCRFCTSITITTMYGFTLELYPTVIRNVGIGSCSTVSRIGSIASHFMKDLSEKVNWSIPFVTVGVLTVTSGLFILPLRETKSTRLNDTVMNNTAENEETLKKLDKKNKEKLLH
ncbi:organic cation transporter protein-like [Centruroides sculpturatus]|uniref:organic cation transporter protein-like n=1 Tax=Centruroides sculpturatus TaxID=218467 RepID=UPI000C6EF2FA|nr:organic cation transporter protein-like [Centruroides sculpturatus]